MSDQPDSQPITWGSKSPTLNIREAEERAQEQAKCEYEMCGEPEPHQMARDFLALAAAYREAVEALERMHSEFCTWTDAECEGGKCSVRAVLAKAHEVLK